MKETPIRARMVGSAGEEEGKVRRAPSSDMKPVGGGLCVLAMPGASIAIDVRVK